MKKELFYNSISKEWKYFINNTETDKRLRIVFKTLFKKIDFKDKKFLEVGCGMGYFSLEANKLGAKVTGIDIGKNLVAITSEKVPNGKFIVASASNLPFKDNSFDLVLSTEVLEHVVNQTKAFKEMMRVLKKEGFLVITTPNKIYLPLFDLLSFLRIRKYQGIEKWYYPWDLKNIINKSNGTVILEKHFNFLYPCAFLDYFEKFSFFKYFMINQAYLIQKRK